MFSNLLFQFLRPPLPLWGSWPFVKGAAKGPAPTHPKARPQQLGSWPWPQQLAAGRPKAEESPLSTTQAWYLLLCACNLVLRFTWTLTFLGALPGRGGAAGLKHGVPPCLRTAPRRPPRTG